MGQNNTVQVFDKRAMSVREFGATYSLSRSSIYKLIQAGRLRTVKVAGKRLIPVAEGERLLAGGDS
jgi:excisionase family DNA binding protein